MKWWASAESRARDRAVATLGRVGWPGPIRELLARLGTAEVPAFVVGEGIAGALDGAPDAGALRLWTPLPAGRVGERGRIVGEAAGGALVVWHGGATIGVHAEPDGGDRDALRATLGRRGLTIHAMAFAPATGELLDPFGGARDRERRRLRAPEDAEARLAEDPARALRVARLAAARDAEPDEALREALPTVREAVGRLPARRVRRELDRLLATPRPSVGLELLREARLLDDWLPELARCRGVPQNRFHAWDVWYHSIHSCDAAPADRLRVRWAALLHDIGKPAARVESGGDATFHGHERIGAELADAVLTRLEVPPADREHIVHLVREHMFAFRSDASDAALRRWLGRVGPGSVADLFDLRIADTLGNGTRAGSPAQLDGLRDRIERVLAAADGPPAISLAVNGDDVRAVTGWAPGPDVGKLLRALRAEVEAHPERNTRDGLLARIRTWASGPPGSGVA